MRRFTKLKLLLLLAVVFVASLIVAPSIAKIVHEDLPDWISENFKRKFKLGLDLQGGLHIEYSVAVDDAIRNNLDRIGGELEAAFREKKDLEVQVERRGVDMLWVRLPSPDKLDDATPDVMAMATDMMERLPDDAENVEAETGIIRLRMPKEVINANRKAILGQAKDTVERRVDSMGVAEPSIYTKNRHVVVELPGMSDSKTELKAAADEAANKLAAALKATGLDVVKRGTVADAPASFTLSTPGADAKAKLGEIYPDMSAKVLSNDRIGVGLVLEPSATPDNTSLVQLALAPEAQDQVLEDSSGFRRLLRIIERSAALEMHLVDDEPIAAAGKAFDGKAYIKALYDAKLVKKGAGFSVNRMSDYSSDKGKGVKVKAPYVFIARDRRTLENFFDGLPKEWQLPATHKIGFERISWKRSMGADPIELYRTHVLKARAGVTGDRIVSASVGYDNDTGRPNVNVKFDSLGARYFDQMSGDNVGRRMAIVMDDLVVSDPVFNERIPGGSVSINMGSSDSASVRQQANDLVKVLKSGSLPARLNKGFEMRVGADLGRDAVVAGFRAFLVGLCGVIIFMVIYYRLSGFIAVFALVMNMLLIMAAMALFQATLTLPGIAGIVLTIGMAVDANVIVFERIREYLRDGYTARQAIESGYDRAFTTILDSQLTTGIAGVVLWQFGSGPIQGFAITLLIGIGTSIFTGVFASRIFFDFQANRSGFDKISI